jgi:septal ring factor EnvC (AmiA/AmiB activator)
VAAAGLSLLGRDQALSPDEQARLRALEQRATERLTVLQREADQLARRQRGLLDQLRALEVKRDLAAAELARTEAALALAQSALSGIDARLTETERSVASLRPAIHRRVAALYRAGPQVVLRSWLGTDDLAASARAARLLAAVTARDRVEFERFAMLRSELSVRKMELEARTRETEALRQRAASEREQATRATAAHAALVRDVDAQRDLTARLAGELETARGQLQQHLAGLPADPSTAATLPIEPFKGALPWPVTGRITRAFGRQASSRFGTTVPRTGIEVGASRRATVRAVHDGRVAFADTFTGFGRLVIVDHGRKAFSLYGYLDEIAVSRGDLLERGQPIGASGESPDGRLGLYFELRIDARPVNPLEWLTR